MLFHKTSLFVRRKKSCTEFTCSLALFLRRWVYPNHCVLSEKVILVKIDKTEEMPVNTSE